MIHYRLQCANEHEFEGWFKDSSAFELQARHGFLDCPVCGSTGVSRALMAPAVVKGRAESRASTPVPASAEAQPAQPTPPVPSAPAAAATPAPAAMEAARLPAQVRAALQRLRAEVEKNCEYVGPAFPEVARSIHRGDVEPRGIYGEASSDEAEVLAEEGVKITRIPWLPRADG